MKLIKIEKLYELKYTANILNCAKQTWNNGTTYSFLENPKTQHLIMCFLNCSADFTLKDGTTFHAPNNSIVYIPEESEYIISFKNCDKTNEFNCYSINFKLFDEENNPFSFEKTIKTYSLKNLPDIISKFSEIVESSSSAVYPTMKITGLFYLLLSDLSGYCRIKKKITSKYKIISKGINALENENLKNIQIDDLAKMCNVSPVYFRRLFKEYSKTTPIEYKLNSLITQAKQHLLYSDKPTSEISDMLGFSSPSYFCRIFKKKTGMTPTEFVKKERFK